MAEACTVCGTATGMRCRYCERLVCPDHERPSGHECTGPRTAPATPESTPAEPGVDPVRAGTALLVGVLLLAVAVIGAASLGPAQAAGGELNETRLERLVHAEVDAARRDRGVGGVVWNESLAGVARNHSTDMARKNYVGHYRDGPLFERYAAAGLSCPGGENVYAVTTVGVANADTEAALARRTVTAWLDSPGHRETLLTERFTRHGVGVALDREDGRTTVYVTEEFC
jgi:uncharacterized protein YkwD